MSTLQSLLILGRQPAIGRAELESLYGADKLRPVGSQAVLLNIDPCLLAFDRLGGSLKFCKVLTVLETTSWHDVETFLYKAAPQHARNLPEGKMQLGLSALGFPLSPQKLGASGLSLKKTIRKTGRSVRLIPNKELELNSAQVIHNHLTGPTGWELVIIRDGQQTIIAQTIKVQDITAYTRRDRERPKRDARVGMLPPKLAQIIINLAVGKLPEHKLASTCEIPAGSAIPRPHFDQTGLDPFCGSGVILQEAILMGYDMVGTDKEQRMVDYTTQNLDWLSDLYKLPVINYRLAQKDATTDQWQPPLDFLASETYLGRPFTGQPTPETLTQTIADCNVIIKKFLRNMHSQIISGTRLCLAIPAWQIRKDDFKQLPLLDSLEEIGYNRVSFEHAQPEDLRYYRPDQIVARQLIVLTRK